MLRKRRALRPYVPPPDAPPLKDVVRELVTQAAKLRALDEEIDRQLRAIERKLEVLGVRRIVRAHIVKGVELAWSMNKRGRWRLVIRDEDDVVDLFNTEPEERLEAINSGALERLVKNVLKR